MSLKTKISFISFLVLVTLILTSFIVPCGTALAAEGDPEYWAVIVGINEYENGMNWHYGIEDAQDVYDEIVPYWGSDHITLLTGTQATRANILAAIDWLAANAKPGDRVIFYFSGWGQHDVLYPYDYNGIATGISGPDLNTAFGYVNAKETVYALGFWESVAIREALAGDGRILMFAAPETGSIWYSNTDQNHIFDGYLADAFSNFNDADANSDFLLTAEEVFYYAADLTTQDHPSQVPVLIDNFVGGFPLMAKFKFGVNIALPADETIVTIDDTDYTSVPSEQLWVPDGTHTITVPEIISGGTGTRYFFQGWDHDVSNTKTISHGSLTASYEKQYLLTINSDGDNLTGDGWYAAGSMANFSVQNYVETTDTKYYFTGWSGDHTGSTPSAAILMDSPKTITAEWDIEYLLAINSEYGTPTGAGWYNAGESVSIAVGEVQGAVIRQVFDGWTGDITSIDASTSVLMNGPKVITATWHSDFLHLYIIIIVVVVAGAGMVTVFVIRNKGGKSGATPPTS